MSTRRRALLINAVTNVAAPVYSMEVVSSLIIHQATSETLSTEWYVSKEYQADETNRTFTLTNPGKCMLSYSSTDTFNTLFLQHYCMQGESSGKTMYYFPAGCTVTHTHDEAAGTYTITVTGRIQKYTMPESLFAFTYSGDFTDERVDGIGDVTFNTSGTLTVISGTATVSAYILAGGGGGSYNSYSNIGSAGGGGGGNKTIEVTLKKGETYEFVLGSGGSAYNGRNATGVSAGNGGDTTAFGETCTGGSGGYAAGNSNSCSGGVAGSPNATAGAAAYKSGSASGGSPNGGSVVSYNAYAGGDGYVKLTFS